MRTIVGTCSAGSCRATVAWVLTARMKKMPVDGDTLKCRRCGHPHDLEDAQDLDRAPCTDEACGCQETVEVIVGEDFDAARTVSHFATCPEASRFHRGGKHR